MNNEIVSTAKAHAPFTELLDLACENIGGKALETSDDFFAEMQNMLKYEPAVFIPGKYTENGKWMDGWESRRKRVPGNDWCIVKLGVPGEIRGVNIDTSFFLGNFPEYASIEACSSDGDLKSAKWIEILPQSKLQGGTHNLFGISSKERFTHVRLNIFPDGGVARFRVHGVVKPEMPKSGSTIDLACVVNGGSVVVCNDAFFGQKDNLIFPERAKNMGEGWETRRKRSPGHDWSIIKLGAAGKITKIEVDTNHFKGNYPDMCSIEACYEPNRELVAIDFTGTTYNPPAKIEWKEILPKTKLKASAQHFFEKELMASGPFTHVRLNIYPDGGISRLRVHGTIEK